MRRGKFCDLLTKNLQFTFISTSSTIPSPSISTPGTVYGNRACRTTKRITLYMLVVPEQQSARTRLCLDFNSAIFLAGLAVLTPNFFSQPSMLGPLRRTLTLFLLGKRLAAGRRKSTTSGFLAGQFLVCGGHVGNFLRLDLSAVALSPVTAPTFLRYLADFMMHYFVFALGVKPQMIFKNQVLAQFKPQS